MGTGRHCLHVYTGTGKGKTSMAAGAAVRMAGHGKKILFAQFLKDGNSGELVSLRALGTVIESMPSVKGFFSRMSEADQETCRRSQQAAAEILRDHIEQLRPEMIVLDELCVALSLGVLNEAEGRMLIETGLRYGETIVTGRGAPDWLEQTADYLTILESRKHPFSGGLRAREGIEW